MALKGYLQFLPYTFPKFLAQPVPEIKAAHLADLQISREIALDSLAEIQIIPHRHHSACLMKIEDCARCETIRMHGHDREVEYLNLQGTRRTLISVAACTTSASDRRVARTLADRTWRWPPRSRSDRRATRCAQRARHLDAETRVGFEPTCARLQIVLPDRSVTGSPPHSAGQALDAASLKTCRLRGSKPCLVQLPGWQHPGLTSSSSLTELANDIE
jgi:hypothetical protein